MVIEWLLSSIGLSNLKLKGYAINKIKTVLDTVGFVLFFYIKCANCPNMIWYTIFCLVVSTLLTLFHESLENTVGNLT